MNQQRNKVRIIAGQWRRRMLAFPDASGLRPTPDRVRETVFNWLGQSLHGKRCLDLFAGSGAMGFEAASRGAAQVVLVEKEKAAARLLEQNRQILKAENVRVQCMDAQHYIKGQDQRFDVIFVDPPYASDLLAVVLPQLPGLLQPDGMVYMESRRWTTPAGWTELRKGKAGQVSYGLLVPASPG